MFSLTVVLGTGKGIIADKVWEGELRSDFEYPDARPDTLDFMWLAVQVSERFYFFFLRFKKIFVFPARYSKGLFEDTGV